MATSVLDIKSMRLAGVSRDSGLSEDAGTMRRFLGEALDIVFPDHLRRAFDELESACEEASRENWDGYGAAPAQLGSFTLAARFLAALPLEAPLPEIGIDPDGEVSFTWQRNPRLTFSVSFRPDGVISYAGLFGRNKTHGTEIFISTVPKVICDNLDRLHLSEG
jgi:hypothetical protein